MTKATQDPVPIWLRIARASVSRRSVLALVVLGAGAVLALLGWLALVPRAAREQGAFELASGFLRACPPTDEIVRQLPPERIASMDERVRAVIARLLQPALLAAVLSLALVTAAYALVARSGALSVRRRGTSA